MDDKALYKLAEKAAEAAYAPFSGYKVGAALVTAGGKVFTGANMENSSYGAAICAERTAAVKALSEGEREFSAIAVAAPGTGGPAWPCGICRQFLFEFADELLVITGADEDNLVSARLDELLPNGFRLRGGLK